MKSKIFYTKPSITNLEIDYATDAATNGWGSKCYEYIDRFEKLFKNYVKVKYAISTSSCTGALHMGLSALDISPGDEVIIADTNWIATASPIIHLGAKPIFVDVLSNSWCIDPDKAEAAITKKTKAIIAVHLYGNVCDMNRLLEIGKKYKIPIIEDAAEGLGSYFSNKHVGSIGKFGTFSFHGSKTLTTGEGGMFVTNDKKLYEKVLTLSNHGRNRKEKKQFWPERIGFKYKISNIQAAIGCAQIERIDSLVKKKREILKSYKKFVKKFSGVNINPEPKGTINGAWMPTIVFDKELNITREMMLAAFASNNIDARVFFWPISSFPMFEPIKSNYNSWDIPKRAINLPSYHDISKNDINRVKSVLEYLINA